jgi:hypothetical protein
MRAERDNEIIFSMSGDPMEVGLIRGADVAHKGMVEVLAEERGKRVAPPSRRLFGGRRARLRDDIQRPKML